MSRCPDYSDVLSDLRNPKTPQYIRTDMPYRDFSMNFVEYKYPFPYEPIDCDKNCRNKLIYRERVGTRPNPFIKKNENTLEDSKNSANNSYMFLYIWFIVMVIIIYVFILAIVSDNSYHPLMNIIIFIFLVYLTYYMFNNLRGMF
jgi:hypothetical protein